MQKIKTELPLDWKLVDLESICENPQYGLTTSSVSKGSVKFLRITDIKDLGVSWNDVPYCECSEADIDKYSLKKNDIVFARIGSTTGKSYIVKNPPKAVFASYLIRIRTKSDVDPDYLSFYLKTEKYWRQINARKNDNLKKGVNASVLKSLMLPFPPLLEQQKIAQILSTVQQAIEQQERLIQVTTELKKALMHKLFTEGTRGEPQKESEIGLVPESWTLKKIGDIAIFQTGGTPSRNNPQYWKDGTIPWVKTTEINNKEIETTQEFITEEGLKNSAAKVLNKGTLLVAMYGQGITRGRVGILGLDAATNQACAAIKPNNENQILTWYLYYYLQYHYQNLRDLGHGANQRNLNMELIKNFSLSFPEIEEQNEIVNLLKFVDKKIKLNEKKKNFLNELFLTLLHQLMTAQIRVHEIEFERIFHRL